MNNTVTKYLIMILDPESLMHFPIAIHDTPPLFNPNIKQEEVHEYEYIKLEGSAFNIKTIEDLFLLQNRESIVKYLDAMEVLEQKRLREIFPILKQFDDAGRQVPDNNSGN